MIGSEICFSLPQQSHARCVLLTHVLPLFFACYWHVLMYYVIRSLFLTHPRTAFWRRLVYQIVRSQWENSFSFSRLPSPTLVAIHFAAALTLMLLHNSWVSEKVRQVRRRIQRLLIFTHTHSHFLSLIVCLLLVCEGRRRVSRGLPAGNTLISFW